MTPLILGKFVGHGHVVPPVKGTLTATGLQGDSRATGTHSTDAFTTGKAS
jgi:hypothetical protein